MSFSGLLTADKQMTFALAPAHHRLSGAWFLGIMLVLASFGIVLVHKLRYNCLCHLAMRDQKLGLKRYVEVRKNGSCNPNVKALEVNVEPSNYGNSGLDIYAKCKLHR